MRISSPNDYEKTKLLVAVASLYYENNFSQSEIAKKLGFSRPYVSKLLAEAQNTGIVKITINDLTQSESRIEREIRQRFELRRAIVVPSAKVDNIHARVGVAAARYLDSIVKSGDTIAIGSGTTIYNRAENVIERDDLEKISVAQFNGFLTESKQNVYEAEIVKRFASALGGVPYILPIPVLVSDLTIKDYMMREQTISEAIQKLHEANIAIFTVGIFSTSIVLKRSRIFDRKRIEAMASKGAVGDILVHFVDIWGRICDPEYDQCVTSLTLDEVKRKEYRITVACGRAKVDAICASLNGGYTNVLITDEDTAEGVQERLELLDAGKVFSSNG